MTVYYRARADQFAAYAYRVEVVDGETNYAITLAFHDNLETALEMARELRKANLVHGKNIGVEHEVRVYYESD